jgi:hypothetical protein
LRKINRLNLLYPLRKTKQYEALPSLEGGGLQLRNNAKMVGLSSPVWRLSTERESLYDEANMKKGGDAHMVLELEAMENVETTLTIIICGDL